MYLANIFQRKGDFAEAAKFYEKALELNPNDSKASLCLANAYASMKMEKKRLSILSVP